MSTAAERRAAALARRAEARPPSAGRLLDLDTPLREARVVVIDVETTGTDPSEARVVEIAAVELSVLGQLVEPRLLLRRLVNPGVPIPNGAADVHGIIDDDVATAPSFAEVWRELAFGDAPFVPCAYNAPYDQQVLQCELERHDLAAPDWVKWGAWLDPLVIVRNADKFEKGKRLTDAAERRAVSMIGHGAAADATVTAHLLPLLLKQAVEGVSNRRGDPLFPALRRGGTVREYLAWQRDRALADERSFADYNKGRKTPPDWTWHDLEGVPHPQGYDPTPSVTRCLWGCGADVVVVVSKDGARYQCEPELVEVVTYTQLATAGPPPVCPHPVRGVDSEHSVVAGWPAEEQPGHPVRRVRRLHAPRCTKLPQRNAA